MSKNRTWSDEQFIHSVKISLSYAQVLINLGLAISGSGYETVKSNIERLNCDTSHFTGQSGAMRYGKSKNLKLEDILTINSSYQSSEIRRHLLKHGLKQNKCEKCGIDEWFGRKIIIELHHKNKIRNDHRLENLKMLCPNCHSQA